MNCDSEWPSASILSWLSNILAERFGHEFCLRVDGDGDFIHMSLADDTSGVDIALNVSAFAHMDSSLPVAIWNPVSEGFKAILDKPLPAPGNNHLPSPLIERKVTGYRVHYDILGLVYWMLCRKEELNRVELDEHQRFTARSSHAHKHGYLERPIVDEWLDILGQVIKRQWPNIELKQHQFSMKVSHDVDEASRYAFRSIGGFVRAVGGDILKRGDLKSAILAPWIRMQSGKCLHPADPANKFDWIMDVSEKHGLTSAFYFICGGKDLKINADYELENPAIRRLLKHIHGRGHEIGLHPSYDSYQNSLAFMKEADHLRRVCLEEGIEQFDFGGRMHYLRWEQPGTLRMCEQAGMSYDSTLGFADHAGFRCGTCFEYPAFDPVANEQLRLRIRPLIAMEGSIMASKYMGLGIGMAALNKFLELKNTCNTVNGCFTLLWHNNGFMFKAHKDLYRCIIEY